MARFIPKRIPHPRKIRIPFFRIFYSTTYTILYIILLVLLAITPAALIYTSFDENAYQYIFEVGGVYILTAILAIFIYTSRLYTNRTVLAAVGKSYIPVEEGEVGKNVRKMIAGALERSAIIALESRPRDLSDDLSALVQEEKAQGSRFAGRIVKVDAHNPPWGRVQHPGWSSPSPIDTTLAPHIQFRTVVAELPNLIEAKAVSLAPPDPLTTPPRQPGDPLLADPAVVELLQRQPGSDLRSYLGHLTQLDLINPPDIGEEFLQQYERARFCRVPITEAEFESLMASFAILLGGMQQLSTTIVGEVRADRLACDFSDSSSSLSPSSRSASIAGSVRKSRRTFSERHPSFYTSATGRSYDTAPSPTTARPRSPTMFVPLSVHHDAEKPSQATHPSRTLVPHLRDANPESELKREPSRETFGSMGSVLRTMPTQTDTDFLSGSSISSSLRSYAGSVIRHSPAAQGGDMVGGGRHGWAPRG